MSVLMLLGWILLVLGLGLVLLLALPVRLALEVVTAPVPTARAEIRLLAGLLPAIPLATPSPERDGATDEASAAPGRARHRRPGAGRRRGSGRFGRRLLRALPRFVARSLGHIHVDRVEVTGRLGLGDPSDTGTLFGWLLPLAHALPSPRYRIRLVPDFSGPVLSGRAAAVLRLRPIAFVSPLVRLLLAALGLRR